MPWPTAISRLYNLNNTAWVDDRERVDEEFNQLVDQFNALLTEAQTQELRITDIRAVIDTLNFTTVVGLNVSIGPNPNAEIRVEADAIPLDDGTIASSCNIIGDFYDDPADGNGGLDTGTIPTVDTWYATWVVGKGGAVDPDPVIVFSLSGDAPDLSRLDAAYNAVRLVYWIRTADDGGGNAELIPFAHHPRLGFVEWTDSPDIAALINNAIPPVAWVAGDELDVSDYLPPGSRRLQIDAVASTYLTAGGANATARLWMAIMGADDGDYRWRRVQARSFNYVSASATDSNYDTNQFDLSTDDSRAVYARRYVAGTANGVPELGVYINGYYWSP